MADKRLKSLLSRGGILLDFIARLGFKQSDLSDKVAPVAGSLLLSDDGLTFLTVGEDGTVSERDLSPSAEELATLEADNEDFKAALREGPLSGLADFDHLWLMDEASGDFIDRLGTLNLTSAALPPASVVGGDFVTSRLFNGTSQYGASAGNFSRPGQAFTLVMGVRFTSISGSDGMAMEGTSNTAQNWSLSRSGNDFDFRVRRVNGLASSNDFVKLDGIEAGRWYVVVARYDKTGLYLYATGLGEAFDNGSLTTSTSGPDALAYPLRIGESAFSATATSRFMDGEIAFAALKVGQVGEDLIDKVILADSIAWRNLKSSLSARASRAARIIYGFDSLSMPSLADPSWGDRVATILGGGLNGIPMGISGETSSVSKTRVLGLPLVNLKCQFAGIFSGNNNSANRQTVIDDVTAMAARFKAAGVGKVLIVGLPNRTNYSLSDATIAAVKADHDYINAGLVELAATDPDYLYLDLQTVFMTSASYDGIHTLTANDLADIARGIVPRGVRDGTGTQNTHLGPLGSDVFAAAAATVLDPYWPS